MKMMNPALLKASSACFGSEVANNANAGPPIQHNSNQSNGQQQQQQQSTNANQNNVGGSSNGPNNSNGGDHNQPNQNGQSGSNQQNGGQNGGSSSTNNTNNQNGGANSLNSPVRTFSPPSPPYATASSVVFQRDMRRHCSNNNSMNHHGPSTAANSHHVTNTNLFSAAGLDVSVAELHDLTSRNQGNLKPDMSSMYHHHMMQSRQPHHHHHHHPHTDMHDFLTSDPMGASLPAALGLTASAAAAAGGTDSGNHHAGSSVVGNQLHTPSAIYSSHHHSTMNMNGMISSLHHHHSSAGGQLSGHPQIQNPFHPHHPNSFVSAAAATAAAASSPHHQLAASMADPSLLEADPRELEVFAERFKQRRIKLGVTQADVGKALANLKLPGVGSLSQSTICRFESLTLSHNNMVALKPILQAWLEAAEAQARKNRVARETTLDICVLPSLDKKRKRTSIAAPEKRSLEAYFSVQPRPSGEKIAAIAEKLDLKKNVVRVWFCNQRQKQKRMKYSAVNGPGNGNNQSQ